MEGGGAEGGRQAGSGGGSIVEVVWKPAALRIETAADTCKPAARQYEERDDEGDGESGGGVSCRVRLNRLRTNALGATMSLTRGVHACLWYSVWMPILVL